MRNLMRLPVGSILLILVSYATFGWLLAVYGSDWRIWIISGAIAIGIEWILALAWAIAAVVLVFSAKPQAFALSIGICLIWALVMYIARLEIRAIASNRIQAFFLLSIIAAIGMSVGWFADTSLIPNFGESIMKVRN